MGKNESETPILLNGYYGDDFKEKQDLIKDLLVNKNIEWDTLNKLMNGELIKFCSPKKKDGTYFWYSW